MYIIRLQNKLNFMASNTSMLKKWKNFDEKSKYKIKIENKIPDPNNPNQYTYMYRKEKLKEFKKKIDKESETPHEPLELPSTRKIFFDNLLWGQTLYKNKKNEKTRDAYEKQAGKNPRKRDLFRQIFLDGLSRLVY